MYSPHKNRRGQVPRRIEVERKKRLFKIVDLTEKLRENGVIAYLKQLFDQKVTHPFDSIPLTLFDSTEFESRPLDEWLNLIVTSLPAGLPARAMRVYQDNEDHTVLIWSDCHIMKYNHDTELFDILFDEPISTIDEIDLIFGEDKEQMDFERERSRIASMERIYLCFDAEDPDLYCKRLADAVYRKKIHTSKIGLSLYVDCMPVDDLKPLDAEQVNRIIQSAVNMSALRNNGQLDTTAIIQQYNLNHMRTLNLLILSKKLKSSLNEVKNVKSVSIDYTLLEDESSPYIGRISNHSIAEYNYPEKEQSFKFNSLWNRVEAIRIISQIQVENFNLEKGNFFAVPEKTVRMEEFSLNQQGSSSSLTQNIREVWVNTVTQSVRTHLKDVRKGWFNIEEDNLEVYNFSKLKKFLFRLNFMMEDTIRNLLLRNVADYAAALTRYCAEKVSVLNYDNVDVKGGKFPLFVVDLKFINATPADPNAVARFMYSASPEMLFDAMMGPFEQVFEVLKGIVKVERRVMKKLFWSHDPTMHVPHGAEEWVTVLRSQLTSSLKHALHPMYEYLQSLKPFLELFSIDIKQYALDAEKKYCPGENLANIQELCNLAKKHGVDSESIYHALPSAVSLGIVLVDCKMVKSMLSNKHRAISSKLFEVVERKTREYAESVVREFRSMFDHVTVTPATIEQLTDLREYLLTLPNFIEQLNDRIVLNDTHFSYLEKARWQLSLDIMDLKWDVFRWPLKMSQELAKQDKNLRILENQFRRGMEEEQEDFLQEIQGLQIEVSKLRDMTKLSAAAHNAEVVRKLKKAIATAEEKARQFNSREGLFNTTLTEYLELSELSKTFEPFYDLWDCCEKWISNKENWTFGPFIQLDSELVENTVHLLQRNLNKSAKAFERLNLTRCYDIAVEVRAEVDIFRPKVPLILALRNPGMRDRHWNDLSEKVGVKIPADKSVMTLQDLCDLGLVKHMTDVEKVSEKAGKEFSIETALDKMAKAWESVILVIEPYRETGTFILKGIDEYMNLLDEHITMTQAMAFSAFKGPFDERIDRWNATLQTVSEVVDEWTQLQRNWLYLQPIFDSPDINKQLPQEGKRFATVDKYWRQTMGGAKKGVLAIRFCDDYRLLDRFKEGNKLLEMVQKGLADYLETKRAGFSRFYFLSNDELLEILSETKDPLRVQPHLRKCFEGIKSVDFQPDMCITGMMSPEGEKVPFVTPVDPKNKNIETWMVEVKDAMLMAIRDNMRKAIIDYPTCARTEWMQKWAAQCVLNGSQFHWTREVEEAIAKHGNQGVWEYYRKLVQQLADMVLLIRGNISKAARVTVGALAVIDVHARDVQRKMAEAGVSDVTDFDWISQMRYYWEEGDIHANRGELAVIMVSSKRWYGYEYLGNTFRLVITPLTDKCYLTLMGALQMILGGAPAGPAGTGKTETTKDLAKALAKQCVVFNCSDGLDYMAM